MIISRAQKTEATDFSGLVSKKHLANLFNQRPELISKVVQPMYNIDIGDELTTYMENIGAVEYMDTNKEMEWYLSGDNERPSSLIEARLTQRGAAINPTSKAGLNNSSFYLVFADSQFFHSHEIAGNRPDRYRLRVIGDPINDGVGRYIVEVQYDSPNDNAFVPYNELTPDTQFSIVGAVSTDTLSNKGFQNSYTSTFKMSNWMTFMRSEAIVPGNMIEEGKNSPLEYKFYGKDAKGKQTSFTGWINKMDWELQLQHRRAESRMLYYGQSNVRPDGSVTAIGESGYEVRKGYGLLEQIAPGNVGYYSGAFNLREFSDFIHSQLCVGKLARGNRRFKCFTGEFGLQAFTRAVENDAGSSKIEFERVKALIGNTYTRPEYTNFYDINGVIIEVILFPDYDNHILHKISANQGHGAAQSYRFTVLDFGMEDGESNIKLIKLKSNGDGYSMIKGLRNPMSAGGLGATKADEVAMEVDGYKVMKYTTSGIRMTNPLRAAEWIPEELA